MMAACKEDKQWSAKRMEGGEGLKTLECLRGRLLAERQASRSAKEKAELLGKKLMELENQLRKETELKIKAEKRLKLLLKKLESLNITSISTPSENSASSEIFTSSSNTEEIEEQESNSENVVSRISENGGEKVPEVTLSKQDSENLRVGNRNDQKRADSSPNSSPRCESLESSYTDPRQTSKISQRKEQSFSVEPNEKENEHYSPASVHAISPASVHAISPAENAESREVNLKAAHVVAAIKHKESIRSSFERGHKMEAIMSM